MIFELMRLTLVLCIVVAPLLFLGQIFLARIRRTTARRLADMDAGLAPLRIARRSAPVAAGASGIDDCMLLMRHATK